MTLIRSFCQGLPLALLQLEDAGFAQIQQLVELSALKGCAFGGALNFQ